MQQTGGQQSSSKASLAVRIAQQIAAATRRAEVRKQQDREILRQIQR
jgi:hypothetical protein